MSYAHWKNLNLIWHQKIALMIFEFDFRWNNNLTLLCVEISNRNL